MDRCPISGDLGVDHLTFEGEGGRLLVQDFFSHWHVVQAQFFRAVHAFF